MTALPSINLIAKESNYYFHIERRSAKTKEFEAFRKQLMEKEDLECPDSKGTWENFKLEKANSILVSIHKHTPGDEDGTVDIRAEGTGEVIHKAKLGYNIGETFEKVCKVSKTFFTPTSKFPHGLEVVEHAKKLAEAVKSQVAQMGAETVADWSPEILDSEKVITAYDAQLLHTPPAQTKTFAGSPPSPITPRSIFIVQNVMLVAATPVKVAISPEPVFAVSPLTPTEQELFEKLKPIFLNPEEESPPQKGGQKPISFYIIQYQDAFRFHINTTKLSEEGKKAFVETLQSKGLFITQPLGILVQMEVIEGGTGIDLCSTYKKIKESLPSNVIAHFPIADQLKFFVESKIENFVAPENYESFVKMIKEDFEEPVKTEKTETILFSPMKIKNSEKKSAESPKVDKVPEETDLKNDETPIVTAKPQTKVVEKVQKPNNERKSSFFGKICGWIVTPFTWFWSLLSRIKKSIFGEVRK